MAHTETCLEKKVVYQGRIITVYNDTVQLENGRTSHRDIVHHNGGVIIAAYDGENVYFVKQYRYAYQSELVELPAGKLEIGEEPLHCAVRELKEEIGATAQKMELISLTYPTVGYCDEVQYIYLATGLSFGEQQLDPGEFLDVFSMSLNEAVEKVMNNEIKDGKTQIGILKQFALKNQGKI